MRRGTDAALRETLDPAPAGRPGTRRLELVESRPVRRNRPVAILKIPRFWSAAQSGRSLASAAHRGIGAAPAEGLDAFGSETEEASEPKTEAPVVSHDYGVTPQTVAAAKWLSVVLLSGGLAVAGVFVYQHRSSRSASTGSVTVETSPVGLDVVLGGKTLGKTPLTTALTPGSYELRVGSLPNVRTIKITVAAGSSIVQRVEFADPALAARQTTGGLRVQTEPAHLPVLIDGEPHGLSPVAIDNLEPGEHQIAVRTTGGFVKRAVSIVPRETLSLIVSSAAPLADPSAVAAGWISVSSPLSLQLREGGKLIGTSESDRLMLPAGDHDIEFGNEALGFAVRKTVHVAAGKTAATKIDLPNGVLSINAQPWAEVFVDGERIGETPIGNLSRRIGPHEVVFRHPDLGERRESVVIAVGKPARIGVDLRKK